MAFQSKKAGWSSAIAYIRITILALLTHPVFHLHNLVTQTDKVGCFKRITQRTHLKKETTKGLKKKQQQMCNKLNLKQIATEKNIGLAEQC